LRACLYLSLAVDKGFDDLAHKFDESCRIFLFAVAYTRFDSLAYFGDESFFLFRFTCLVCENKATVVVTEDEAVVEERQAEMDSGVQPRWFERRLDRASYLFDRIRGVR